jgi:hypothetical protein
MSALFREIRVTADLPEIGQAVEVSTMDLKAQPARGDDRSYDRREMAKDAAMFANANGGVILVGACETAGVLSAYKPISDEEVPALKHEYELAARDLCSPSPIVDVVPVALQGSPGSVVAVNVFPFPASPVGVLWKKDGGVPYYAFPLRVSSHPIWLRAEQLPMLMVPELRRMAILIDSIPLGERENVDLVMHQGNLPYDSYRRPVRLKSVDPLGGSFTTSQGGGPAPEISLTIPLDAVTSVWRSAGRWRITLVGRIDQGQYVPRWT